MSTLLNNLDGIQTYTLGDTIELMFRSDEAVGDTMTVVISDIFDNIIDTIIADRLSDDADLWIAEYQIPLDLGAQYNTLAATESGDTTLYYMKDTWYVNGNIPLTFDFQVLRKPESPTEENNVIQIFLEGIQGTDGSVLPRNMLAFTTLLNPYYTSVSSVKDTYRELLDSYDNFTVARQIINTSKIVDYHMKPTQIYRKDAFNLAVSNYVKLKCAWNLLLSVIQVNQEKKTLDNFSIERNTAGPKMVLDQIEEQMRKFALFIWAGGNDTPFFSQTFEKGLFDPNRPNLSRAKLDSTGTFPWVNSSSRSTIVEIDGNSVEVRGERMVAFPYTRSRLTNSVDQGDVGYLSGI